MSLFDRAKFILTANAYKAGKLYSLKGHDIPFVRSSSASRINSLDIVESISINTPRLNNTVSASKILIESSAVNIMTIQNISVLGGGTVILNNGLAPSGDNTAHTLIFGAGINDAAFIPLGGLSATPSAQYTFSFWARSISGNGNVETRLGTNTNTALNINLVAATSTWKRFSVTFTTDSGASSFSNQSRFRNQGNSLGEVEIWGMQLELGAIATSYMPPNALTRAADQPESFNPVSLGYLLANEGTIVINDTVYKYTTDGNMETFISGVSQGTTVAAPPTSWTLPVGETERVLMFDYPLTTNEIEAL